MADKKPLTQKDLDQAELKGICLAGVTNAGSAIQYLYRGQSKLTEEADRAENLLRLHQRFLRLSESVRRGLVLIEELHGLKVPVDSEVKSELDPMGANGAKVK